MVFRQPWSRAANGYDRLQYRFPDSLPLLIKTKHSVDPGSHSHTFSADNSIQFRYIHAEGAI